jgi:hypothetical protein
MTIRFARAKKLTQIAVIAAAVTGAGLGVGSGVAQARPTDPHPHPHFGGPVAALDRIVDRHHEGSPLDRFLDALQMHRR